MIYSLYLSEYTCAAEIEIHLDCVNLKNKLLVSRDLQPTPTTQGKCFRLMTPNPTIQMS